MAQHGCEEDEENQRGVIPCGSHGGSILAGWCEKWEGRNDAFKICCIRVKVITIIMTKLAILIHTCKTPRKWNEVESSGSAVQSTKLSQEHFLTTEDDSKYKVLPHKLSRHLVQELITTK